MPLFGRIETKYEGKTLRVEPWPDNKVDEDSHPVDLLYSEFGIQENVIRDLYCRMHYHRMMELKLARRWANRKDRIEKRHANKDEEFLRRAKNDDIVMADALAGQKWHTEEANSLANQLQVELMLRHQYIHTRTGANPDAMLNGFTLKPE